MPYYRHGKQNEPETGDRFFTRTDALVGFDPREQKITFVPTSTERASWQSREADKFSDGEYVYVPWSDRDQFPDHYVHISLNTAGHVAYTADDESGHLDKQTSLKVGRYLQRFYADKFTSAEIAQYVATVSGDGYALKIATSPDDIETVYVNGPNSCMAHSESSYSSSEHPVRVYGDSDLAVAYYGNMDSASARAVIWPEKKIYSRLYGAEQTLRRMLENAGYTSGSLRGARIRAVECRNTGSWIVPYVDCCTSGSLVRSNGRQWIMLGSGDIDLRGTDGIAEPNRDDQFYCDGCSDYQNQDNYGGSDANHRYSYCSDCYSERFTCCEACNENVASDSTYIDHSGRYDRTLCEDCYNDASETCAVCDTSFNPLEWSRSDRQTREANDTETLCDDCAENHVYCSQCETHYCTDEKPTIARIEFVQVDGKHDGIFPADLVLAVETENPLRQYCTECNRDVVCERTGSIIAEINTQVGSLNLLALAETTRETIALPVYVQTVDGLRIAQRRAYVSPFDSRKWSYSDLGTVEFQTPDYIGANARFESCRLLETVPAEPVTVYRNTRANAWRTVISAGDYRTFEYSHPSGGNRYRFPYGPDTDWTSDKFALAVQNAGAALAYMASADRQRNRQCAYDCGGKFSECTLCNVDAYKAQHADISSGGTIAPDTASVNAQNVSDDAAYGNLPYVPESEFTGEDIQPVPVPVFVRSHYMPQFHNRVRWYGPQFRETYGLPYGFDATNTIAALLNNPA